MSNSEADAFTTYAIINRLLTKRYPAPLTTA